MQKFLCMHTMPANSFSREQVCQFAESAQHDDHVRGYRSFINLSEGKGCCILEADDRQAVAAWFQRVGIPYDCIVPVELEGERGVIEDLKEHRTLAGVS